MALDLSNTLVIGISATALFDMCESDRMFQETSATDPDGAIEQYRAYMLEHENEPLKPGTGYPLIKALLGLNQYKQAEDKSPLVEVVVMSRNSPETGIRVLNTIRHDKLNISRSAFTAGETVADYLDAFDVDLFLTTNLMIKMFIWMPQRSLYLQVKYLMQVIQGFRHDNALPDVDGSPRYPAAGYRNNRAPHCRDKADSPA